MSDRIAWGAIAVGLLFGVSAIIGAIAKLIEVLT